MRWAYGIGAITAPPRRPPSQRADGPGLASASVEAVRSPQWPA